MCCHDDGGDASGRCAGAPGLGKSSQDSIGGVSG